MGEKGVEERSGVEVEGKEEGVEVRKERRKVCKGKYRERGKEVGSSEVQREEGVAGKKGWWSGGEGVEKKRKRVRREVGCS